MSVDHYENFPVASILLPKRFHHPVTVIYRFARQADDIADEGDATDEARLQGLQSYRDELDNLRAKRTPSTQLFADLEQVIVEWNLPFQPFYDLLSAFSQDVTQKRYHDYGQLLDYCQRSANPVGRLLLHLYGVTDSRSMAHADHVCSSLQLINFWQDIAIDWKKNRVYLPQDELARFGITEQQIANNDYSGSWWPMMQMQLQRAGQMLQAGAPLGRILKGRLGLEMRMIMQGGDTILRKIHQVKGDVFHQRPVLTTKDWLTMSYRALMYK